MEVNELSWQARGRLWLRLLVRFLLFLLLIVLVYKVGLPVLSYCMPFVMGLIFAWLMEPLVRFLIDRSIFSRKSVSILLILLICGILGGLFVWLIYKVFVEISSLSANWSLIWDEISLAFMQVSEFTNRFLEYLPPEISEVALNLSNQLLEIGRAHV